MSSSSRTTYAETKTKCRDVISACDKALADQKKQIELRDLRLVDSDSRMRELEKTNEGLRSSLDAWYRSPYLWLTAGLVLGVFGAGRLVK